VKTDLENVDRSDLQKSPKLKRCQKLKKKVCGGFLAIFFDLSLDFINFSFNFCKGRSPIKQGHNEVGRYSRPCRPMEFTVPLDAFIVASLSSGIGFDLGDSIGAAQ
jgi:hypothetical protein